jgi:uncharacterized membrane protein
MASADIRRQQVAQRDEPFTEAWQYSENWEAYRQPPSPSPANVGMWERAASLAAGSLLTAYGLFRAQRGRLPLAAFGAMVAGRGLTGRCPMYRALGIDTATRHDGEATVIPAQRGEKIEKAVTINRSAADLYAYWRKLDNLPRIMRHLKGVEVVDQRRSHWVADGALGRDVEWDAEIIKERENEVIAWASRPGGDVDTAGSVRFKTLSHGRGTEVAVALKYDPPAGRLGTLVANFMGLGLTQRIAEDLRNFKRVMETGEMAVADVPSQLAPSR